MSSTFDLQRTMQLAITLPIITLVYYDSIFTLQHMHSKCGGEHNGLVRDLLFLCAIIACINILSRCFMKSLIIINEKQQELTVFSCTTSQNKNEPKKAANNTATTKQEKADSAMPAKAPTTPPPAKESVGPNEE